MPDYAPVIFLCFVIILVAPFTALYFFLQKRDKASAEERRRLRKDLNDAKEDYEKAEQSLAAKEHWYHQLLDSTSDMVLIHGVTDEGLPGVFTEANKAACKKLGYNREKLLTMTPMDIEESTSPTAVLGYVKTDLATLTESKLREHQHIFARTYVARILEKGHVVSERKFLTAEGTAIPVEVSARKFDLDGDPIIVCTAQDLSERKATEQALQDSEHRFHDFFAQSPIGVALYDANREVVNVNQACLKILAIPDQQEFAKFNPFDNVFMPDSVRQSLAVGDSTRYEIMIDFEEVKAHQLFVSSHRKKGYYDIVVNSLGHDRNFKLRGYLVQIVDVTKRRETEVALRQIERQLQQAQKMEAIGTLAGGIAHDFNNILTPIIGYAEMTLHMLKDNETLNQYMKEVVKASHRAKELVNQILAFSRQADPEGGKPIKITPIVKEVTKLQRAAFPANIDINLVIKTDHDVVVTDPTQVHQILMNLYTNAAHAIGSKGGQLEVRLTDFMHIERPGTEFPELTPGRYLRLSVKDDGAGMDKATVERIFEPFFTTKDRGEGTGMGLAVVHGIIVSLKGTIKVETAPSKGTTFHVILPVVEEAEAVAAETVDALPSGSEKVLFVDDDKEIVKMAEQMLSNLGYEAVIAHQANAALRLFSLEPENYDLVITDMVMPGMNGRELAEEIRKIRRDTRVLLCTGFSEIPNDEELAELGISGLLMKPIVMREMAEKIRTALEDRG